MVIADIAACIVKDDAAVIKRDADKVDILRVFNRSSCTAVLGIGPDAFSRGEISDVAFERSASGVASRAMSVPGRSTASWAPSASPSSWSCPRPARYWGPGGTFRRSCASPSGCARVSSPSSSSAAGMPSAM